VIALRETQGDAPAIRLAHRVLKAVWEDELNPSEPDTLARLIGECGLDAPAVTDIVFNVISPYTNQVTPASVEAAGSALASVVSTQVWGAAQYPLALTNPAQFATAAQGTKADNAAIASVVSTQVWDAAQYPLALTNPAAFMPAFTNATTFQDGMLNGSNGVYWTRGTTNYWITFP
jgi:propanediol dehydratase small subunit